MDIPIEERNRRGVDDRLLRFSVGVEEVEDLIADVKQALYAAKEVIEGVKVQ